MESQVNSLLLMEQDYITLMQQKIQELTKKIEIEETKTEVILHSSKS